MLKKTDSDLWFKKKIVFVIKNFSFGANVPKAL